MKKQIALLLALVMLLSLAACGEPEATDPSGIPNLDFGAILSGNGATDYIWGKQDEATKQQLIAGAKKEGLEVSFGADGTMTIKDPKEGSTVVQKPDGNWVIKNEDGSEGQLGGDWPDNEFTRLLPKPGFGLYAAATDSGEFTVLFKDASIEKIREYTDQVKAKGFTVDAQVEDESAFGMTVYTYAASNGNGYRVEIFSAMGASGLTVCKEDSGDSAG